MSPLLRRRRQPPAAVPLERPALERFVAALDAESRLVAEEQIAAIDNGHRGRRALLRVTAGRTVLLPVSRRAPPFAMTRPATVATVSLRADDGRGFAVDVGVDDGYLAELSVRPAPLDVTAASAADLVLRIDVGSPLPGLEHEDTPRVEGVLERWTREHGAEDLSPPVVGRDRSWFAGALPFAPPAEYLQLCALSDGLTVGPVRVYPLAEAARTPVGDDDDLLYFAELVGEAVFLGILRSDESDEPVIHAVEHDVPDVSIPLGSSLTAVVEAFAVGDPALREKLGRTRR